MTEFVFYLQIKHNEPDSKYVSFRSVLSLLSYLCKAPLVPNGTPVVNSLFRQRAAIENILRACVGLTPISNLSLEQRVINISQIQSQWFNTVLIPYTSIQQFELGTNAEPPIKKVKTANGAVNIHATGTSNGSTPNGSVANGSH